MSDIWDNSSFLDLTGYGLIDPAIDPAIPGAVGQAYGFTSPGTIDTNGNIVVALVLPRQNDPTALLSEDWAQREAQLDGLTQAQVGAEYGADPTVFQQLTATLDGIVGAKVLGPDEGYVTSVASRTVWVRLDASAFQDLFGQELMVGQEPQSDDSVAYWDGNLTPNSAILPTLAGMWAETTSQPPAYDLNTTGAALPQGAQGVGNQAGPSAQTPNATTPTQLLYPSQIAAEYHFPLMTTGASTEATPAVGLIEPGASDTEGDDGDPTQQLQAFRQKAGITGTGTVIEGQVENSAYGKPDFGERNLDFGVVSAAAPNSDIINYAGHGDAYSAFEEAIWSPGAKPSDLSSSYPISAEVAPNSPFAAAIEGIYEDAALNNISVFQAAGDGGSSAMVATGTVQVRAADVSPYTVSVGGASTSSLAQLLTAGAADPNSALGASIAQAAVAGDIGTLDMLVAGGLTIDPTSTAAIASFLQTTWNQYILNNGTLSPSYLTNEAGGGGVDPNLPEPSYQQDAGIDTAALQTADGIADATGGKGDPDVSALAGGNSHYLVPGDSLTGLGGDIGTSAASPLWASLSAQIQAIFLDQGLPTTGYFNDLLYQAAVIDPAAFNDVQVGGNTSSFIFDNTGSISADGTTITPTGLGYTAGPGYDLTTGLGTPDGILLARALTQIAQAEEYSPNATPVSDSTGLVSAADQALIVQPVLATDFTGMLTAAGETFTPASDGTGFGWSARIAQDVLQSYFDPDLVTAIGGQAQASSTQIEVTDGQSLAVTIGGTAATPMAQQDTSAFGYVTDETGGNAVTLARPLAVAETYGGQDDVNAIVRLRQDSPDLDSLSFYRVDDLGGDIDGTAPGQAGYAAAAAGRAYSFAGGGQSVAGPSDGNFLQTEITGVDNGDLIGFSLTDQTTGQTYWGLAAQNAGGTNDLWSYGANTWGFDDGSDAGQAAFSDLLFQLDFTSNAGSGLLVNDTSGAAPTSISGTAAEQTATEGQPISPFSAVSITDTNPNQTEAVTVSLSNANGQNVGGNGALSGAGVTYQSPAIYTLAPGTPAEVTQELRGATFTPSADGLVSDGSIATIFTINVTDSAGQSATDDTTSVEAMPAPCFAEGTLIATPDGDVPVEDLHVGDHVLTLDGRARPIVWMGHRRVNGERHPQPGMVRPIRIRAGAMGPGRPARDLLVSPDHAIFIGGVLIPARMLVNNRSVTVARDLRRVTYFHIELPSHDVVLAEGLPAESYLDSGDRHAFENGGPPVPSHADGAGLFWEAAGFAPLIICGPALAAARAQIR